MSVEILLFHPTLEDVGTRRVLVFRDQINRFKIYPSFSFNITPDLWYFGRHNPDVSAELYVRFVCRHCDRQSHSSIELKNTELFDDRYGYGYSEDLWTDILIDTVRVLCSASCAEAEQRQFFTGPTQD